jgi:hypothetical protein
MFGALGGGDMVPDLGVGGGAQDAKTDDPTTRKHKSLCVGDLVYFAALAEDKVGEGYLHGEGYVLDRLGLQAAGPTGIPANFEECIFRVTPLLVYEATTMSRGLARNKSMTEEEMKNLLKRCEQLACRNIHLSDAENPRSRAFRAARRSRRTRTRGRSHGSTRRTTRSSCTAPRFSCST